MITISYGHVGRVSPLTPAIGCLMPGLLAGSSTLAIANG